MADLYRDTPLRLAAHLQVPHKVTVGPWAHLYPHEALPTPAVVTFRKRCVGGIAG